MSDSMIRMLIGGTWETIVMTFVSGFFGFVLGLPTGVLLFITRKGQILDNKPLNRFISIIVNIFWRNMPDAPTRLNAF